MTPGIVVSIRVNPTDVMAVIDTLDHLGIPKANLSFAQATKLVLSSALESFRQNGLVPRRTGFEYLSMIEPFERQNFASRGAKLRTAKVLRQPNTFVQPAMPGTVVEEDYETRQRRVRFEELTFKQQADSENFTTDDASELAPLTKEFQP